MDGARWCNDKQVIQDSLPKARALWFILAIKVLNVLILSLSREIRNTLVWIV